MGIRPVLCLALLASLPAAEATAASRDSNLTAGAAQLIFSKRAVSALPIDIAALAQSTCEEEVPSEPYDDVPSEPMGKCRLKVITTGEEAQLGAELPPLPEPSPYTQWQATDLDLASEPVETSCGIWDVSLSLDATDPQPISPMVLKPAADDSNRGTFASVLEIDVRLHLTNRTTGQAVDHPLKLGIGLTGPWRLAPPEIALPPAQSNLLLFATWEEQCFPVWFIEPKEYMLLFINEYCQFCFEMPESSGEYPSQPAS